MPSSTHSIDDSLSSSNDSEPSKYYRPGGYHPTQVNEEFHNRYKAIEKIGWGRFSTVWKVKDPKRKKYRAIKIVKSKQIHFIASHPLPSKTDSAHKVFLPHLMGC